MKYVAAVWLVGVLFTGFCLWAARPPWYQHEPHRFINDVCRIVVAILWPLAIIALLVDNKEQ